MVSVFTYYRNQFSLLYFLNYHRTIGPLLIFWNSNWDPLTNSFYDLHSSCLYSVNILTVTGEVILHSYKYINFTKNNKKVCHITTLYYIIFYLRMFQPMLFYFPHNYMAIWWQRWWWIYCTTYLTVFPSGAPAFTPGCKCDSCCSISSFLCNVL